MMPSPWYKMIALKFNDHPVGGICGHVSTSPFTGDIESIVDFIYVAPDYRFGLVPIRILLSDFEVWAKGNGATSSYCNSYKYDAGSILMRRCGYNEHQRSYRKIL